MDSDGRLMCYMAALRLPPSTGLGDSILSITGMQAVDIQSKYYNGLRNTLDGVSEHSSRNPGFASGEGRYHIPETSTSSWTS